MKSIIVSYIGDYKGFPDLAEISNSLDGLSMRWPIDIINWDEFAYQPSVKFVIAYSNMEIFIKYYVEEEYIKAEKIIDNEMVCEDSCVEFFIAPGDTDHYYNFEFNAIGTCYAGKGTGRHDSGPIGPGNASRIRRHSSLGNKPFGERQGKNRWELTLAIPLDLIFNKREESLRGKRVKANFYKCGDMLSKPHFLTWNRVDTEEPDYHRPEFFGELIFD